jgi:Zn-dependent membrane protease YugP
VSQGIIRGQQQVEGIEKVLGAAAWTYVAGAVSSAGSFLYVAYIVYSMVRRK